MKNIAVIIVNWNGWKDTIGCLRSLEDMQKDSGFGIHIIVVDNASNDDSVEKIRQRFANVFLIANSTNEGFSGGYNRGLRYAIREKYDFIVVANNDTIFAPDCIMQLAAVLESSKKIGIVGPKIYFAPGHEFHHDRYRSIDRGKIIWYAGGRIDWSNILISHRGVDEIDCGQYNKNISTDFVSGCAMMIRRSVFERVGLFDERYYLYYEDIDLNLRAKKANFDLHFVPGAILWHKNAGSSRSGSNLQDYYLTRNRFLFGMTYAPIRSKIALSLESIKLLQKGRYWQKRGIMDALSGRWGQGTYAKD